MIFYNQKKYFVNDNDNNRENTNNNITNINKI